MSLSCEPMAACFISAVIPASCRRLFSNRGERHHLAERAPEALLHLGFELHQLRQRHRLSIRPSIQRGSQRPCIAAMGGRRRPARFPRNPFGILDNVLADSPPRGRSGTRLAGVPAVRKTVASCCSTISHRWSMPSCGASRRLAARSRS